MSKQLKALMARMTLWPKEAQEEAVQSLRAIEEEFLGTDDLLPEDRAALARNAENVRLGRLAYDEDILDIFD